MDENRDAHGRFAPGHDSHNPMFVPGMQERTDHLAKTISRVEFERRPTTDVKLSELHSGQASYNQDKVNKIASAWDSKAAGEIYVYQFKNGEKYVLEGNHRVLAAKQGGKQILPAKVIHE